MFCPYVCYSRSMSGRGCVSRCLFSGSRGEVCVAEPLHIPEHARNATNAQTMLVAMITFTKVSQRLRSFVGHTCFLYKFRSLYHLLRQINVYGRPRLFIGQANYNAVSSCSLTDLFFWSRSHRTLDNKYSV